MRKRFTRVVTIPASTHHALDYRFTCDGCGAEIQEYPDFEIGDLFANTLELLLNQDQCVNQAFRKDFCTPCLEPIWNAVCVLLGVDPEDLSRSTYEEQEEDDDSDVRVSGDHSTDD